MNKNKYFIPIFAMSLMLTSCFSNGSSLPEQSATSVEDNANTGISIKSEQLETVTTTTAMPAQINTEYSPDTDIDNLRALFPQLRIYASEWDELSAYVEINGNIPFFSKDDKELSKAFERYSELDALGRCGTAYVNVGTEIMPTEERGSIGQVKPSGWQTAKYDKSVISDMYLYNRCHLIAYMLAGENANEKNLITGTRYLNIDGMLPFESMVDDYIEDNPKNHVLYRVTPMYKGNDLVAQGVLMEGWSVEDKGELSFCVWCYNVQPKIEIDYSNGNNHLIGEQPETLEEAIAADEYTFKYVLNENSKKIHLPDCSAAEKIAKENRTETNRTYEELNAQGYSPCGICNAS